VKRHVLVVGPARRQRRYLFVDFGPVRPRGHTPTATPGRSRPRIVPHERSESIVYELQDNQAADLAVRARDEAGNVVPLDGVLEWSVSDDTVLALSVSADGATATVAATGKLGTSQVQAKDTATAGQSFAGTLDVEVVVGPAVSIEIVPGEAHDATP
jgi:hypothetical protein